MINYANDEQENIIIFQEDYIKILNYLEDLRAIYHPAYSKDGNLPISQLINLKSKNKEIIINLDRNIFTDLIQISKQGTLNDKKQLKNIAFLMSWAELNDLAIMPYDAIAENAYKVKENSDAWEEMECFDFLFNNVSVKSWIQTAFGGNDIFPTINGLIVPKDKTIDFTNETFDFMMHFATILHLVNVFRSDLDNETKIKDFFSWYFKHSIICQYTTVYSILLFSNQPNIKAPKSAKSNNIEQVIAGCKNQARDILYLSDWSKSYSNEEAMNCILLFATFDDMLGKIFSTSHSGFTEDELFIKYFKNSDSISQFYNDLKELRMKPEMGNDKIMYCNKLIAQEIQSLQNSIK